MISPSVPGDQVQNIAMGEVKTFKTQQDVKDKTYATPEFEQLIKNDEFIIQENDDFVHTKYSRKYETASFDIIGV